MSLKTCVESSFLRVPSLLKPQTFVCLQTYIYNFEYPLSLDDFNYKFDDQKV